jgi:hypothetical protein
LRTPILLEEGEIDEENEKPGEGRRERDPSERRRHSIVPKLVAIELSPGMQLQQLKGISAATYYEAKLHNPGRSSFSFSDFILFAFLGGPWRVETLRLGRLILELLSITGNGTMYSLNCCS